MEFLGDAILGMVVVDYLYRAFASMEEGEMTKIKSAVVSRASCAVVAARVGLGELVILGKGMTGRRELPQSVLASVYESVVGALYLDGGLEPAQTFILRDMEDRIRRADRSGHQSNFKSVLQQVAVQRELGVPTYHVLDEKGPDHAKCFEVCVEIVAIDSRHAGQPARSRPSKTPLLRRCTIWAWRTAVNATRF